VIADIREALTHAAEALFFLWCQKRWREQLGNQEKVVIRTDKPIQLADAA
jgi:hypothetical protein